MEEDDYYWCALSAMGVINAKVLLRLIGSFGSAKEVFYAKEQLLRASGLLDKKLEKFTVKRDFDYPKKLQEFCGKNAIHILKYGAAEYPERLANILYPPSVLYVKGILPDFKNSIGVVGSRKASEYGVKVAEKFSASFAKEEILVVSGGARGIDTAAHKGALMGGGPTVAVLGCGIDVIYPYQNKKLYEEIVENGAIVTEYPPETPPIARNFPLRNRVINGLTAGILVVEAAKKSGAMITAEFAIDEGHEVYCIPGNVFLSTSIGCHSLIKSGATLVDCPEDIIQEFKPVEPKKRKNLQKDLFQDLNLDISDTGKLILGHLSAEPISMENLIEVTGLSLTTLSSEILNLQIEGLLGILNNNRYYRI